MPKIRSAKKRLRQARARNALNRTQRAALRTAIKKVRAATTAADARAAYQAAERLLDRAARKNLIHRNVAARQKSRMQKTLKGKTA